MNIVLYTVSLLLAALMGFAVHRASVCTVKTVGEILSSRKAYMMATLVKAVLWVVAVFVPILLCLPDAPVLLKPISLMWTHPMLPL